MMVILKIQKNLKMKSLDFHKKIRYSVNLLYVTSFYCLSLYMNTYCMIHASHLCCNMLILRTKRKSFEFWVAAAT